MRPKPEAHRLPGPRGLVCAYASFSVHLGSTLARITEQRHLDLDAFALTDVSVGTCGATCGTASLLFIDSGK